MQTVDHSLFLHHLLQHRIFRFSLSSDLFFYPLCFLYAQALMQIVFFTLSLSFLSDFFFVHFSISSFRNSGNLFLISFLYFLICCLLIYFFPLSSHQIFPCKWNFAQNQYDNKAGCKNKCRDYRDRQDCRKGQGRQPDFF